MSGKVVNEDDGSGMTAVDLGLESSNKAVRNDCEMSSNSAGVLELAMGVLDSVSCRSTRSVAFWLSYTVTLSNVSRCRRERPFATVNCDSSCRTAELRFECCRLALVDCAETWTPKDEGVDDSAANAMLSRSS